MSSSYPPAQEHTNGPEHGGSLSSVGELLGEISGDISTLMRQEVELAKSEIRQSAQRAGKGTGLLAGAAVGGHMVLLFLSIALWWGLGNAIGRGLVGARRRRDLGDHRRHPGVDGPVPAQGGAGPAQDHRHGQEDPRCAQRK